jgi:hypothetical protein
VAASRGSATLTAMDPEPPLRPKTLMDLLLERMAIQRTWVQPLVGRTCSRITINRYSPLLVLAFTYDGPAARQRARLVRGPIPAIAVR